MNERIFLYVEPGDFGIPVEIYVTETEIIAQYYPSWAKRMRELGKGDQISHENCIDDFCISHWAVEQN